MRLSVVIPALNEEGNIGRLVEEADELVDTMNQIHDAVHSGRSRATMRTLVEHAQFHLRNLDRRIGRSDYLHATPGYHYSTPTGYIAYPPTHHPGHVHVDSTQRLLDRLSSNLRQLETDLAPPVHYHHHPKPFVYGYGNYGW